MAQDGPKMASRRPQDGPKTPRHRPKTAPRRLQDGPRWPQDVPRRPNRAPRRPQERSKSVPRGLQEAMCAASKGQRSSGPSLFLRLPPTWPQDLPQTSPREAHDCPKRDQQATKMAPRSAQGSSTMLPRRTTARLQIVSGWAKMAPRRPKTTMYVYVSMSMYMRMCTCMCMCLCISVSRHAYLLPFSQLFAWASVMDGLVGIRDASRIQGVAWHAPPV